MPGAKEAGQGKDLLEEEVPDERESVETAQGPPGKGALPVPGECSASPASFPPFPCPYVLQPRTSPSQDEQVLLGRRTPFFTNK